MHVKISRTFGLCTLVPWLTGLEAELTFTKVEHRHGYVPKGERKVNLTPKRLYHVPDDRPTEGTFAAGLLPRVLEFLQARGHSHEFSDYRDLKKVKPLPDFTKVDPLRSGQGEALVQIAYADFGIIVAATAFGKSFVITQACKMYPTLRIMVVTPRVAVVNMLHDKLCAALGKDQVGRAGGGNSILGRRVMVSTTKSMKKVDPSEVDLMFFDEVHGVGDNDVATMIGYYSNCRRFGFTASPVRGDKSEMCMEALFGRFLVEFGYQESVTMGNVVPIDVYMVTVTGDIHQSGNPVQNKRNSYWRNTHRNKVIAKVARRIPKEEQCLIMVETLEHAVHLSKELPEYTLVHFGIVREPYLAHEWRELTPAQISRVGGCIRETATSYRAPGEEDEEQDPYGWVRVDTCSYRSLEPEDTQMPRYGWVAMDQKDTDFQLAAKASGRKVCMLGRCKTYDDLCDVDTDDVWEGDYYLVKKEEFILDVPKESLKLTTKEKETLRKRFESGELKKVIATTTWKEG